MALSGDRARLYDEDAKRKSGITGDGMAVSWQAVRSSAGASWLCARLDATGKVLELVAHGEEGGLPALRSHLADDCVTWGAFAFSPGYPYGDGSHKFAFMTCVGPAVGAMKKGKVALQKSGVQMCFEGAAADSGLYQGVVEATDEAIIAELRRNMPKAELLT